MPLTEQKKSLAAVSAKRLGAGRVGTLYIQNGGHPSPKPFPSAPSALDHPLLFDKLNTDSGYSCKCILCLTVLSHYT